MNTQQPTTPPVQTIRDGALFTKIWKNVAEKGFRYSVQLGRTYSDEQGNLHDTSSFSGSELLRIARLAQIAYDEVLIHREQDKQAAADTSGS